MSNEGIETFEVGPKGKSERREPVVSKKVLHVTVIDHRPVVVRIPLGMVEAGLRMIPPGKLGDVDPALIVQMVEMGAEGEIVKLQEEKRSISIRVE
jgi:hypothetical protein